MKVRIGEMLVLLALLGAGLGVSRWAILDQDSRRPSISSARLFRVYAPGIPSPIFKLMDATGRPILGGIAFITGLAICLDRKARRPPRVWGAGRWLLATWSVTVILAVCLSVCSVTISSYRLPGPRLSLDELAGFLSSAIANTVRTGFVCFSLAGLLAARLSGWPRDPTPDLTEWSGRALFVMMVLMVVVLDFS